MPAPPACPEDEDLPGGTPVEPPSHPPERPGHPLTAADAWALIDKEVA